jgi:hypothetical protein
VQPVAPGQQRMLEALQRPTRLLRLKRCLALPADPRGDLDQLVTYDCFYQRSFGNCNETYMFDANAELAPEGFCQISCSRCNCCVSPYDALLQLKASRFLQVRPLRRWGGSLVAFALVSPQDTSATRLPLLDL